MMQKPANGCMSFSHLEFDAVYFLFYIMESSFFESSFNVFRLFTASQETLMRRGLIQWPILNLIVKKIIGVSQMV